MNLLDLKKVMDEIIVLLDGMVEACGHDGDFDGASSFQEDQDMFIKAKEELSGYQNSYIMPLALPNILKETVPDLSIDSFKSYLGTLRSRKVYEIIKLQAEISEHNNMLGVFE